MFCENSFGIWNLVLKFPPTVVVDVVPDAHVESGTRRSACHSTLRSPAKSPLTCLNTQTTLKGGYLTHHQTFNLSVRKDINQSGTKINRKIRSHLVGKQHINCHFMFFFLLFLVFFGFFTVFCSFLFLSKIGLGFSGLYNFLSVLRFLFNCF